jgi:carotenoid isomerooxygenase
LQEEDDGVVLLVLLWPGDQDKKVALVILEAKTFTEIGRTVFETPGPVPKCLHGWFTNTY